VFAQHHSFSAWKGERKIVHISVRDDGVGVFVVDEIPGGVIAMCYKDTWVGVGATVWVFTLFPNEAVHQTSPGVYLLPRVVEWSLRPVETWRLVVSRGVRAAGSSV
jgi:hypothetical protein